MEQRLELHQRPAMVGLGKAKADLAIAIVDAVAAAFDVTRTGMISPRRHMRHARARFAALVIMDQSTTMTTTQMGGVLGNRDRSTIAYGIHRGYDLCDTDESFKYRVGIARRSLTC